ncbi:hypothetical protein GmHk_U060067 [Glycine max]|nr:hypothetical protein GmHk_U060067 [Glycine max]
MKLSFLTPFPIGGVNNPTLGEFLLHNDKEEPLDIGGSKSNAAYERLAATSQLSLWIDKSNAFTVRIRTSEIRIKRAFTLLFLTRDLLSVELILGHLRYSLTDVLPSPNSHLTMSSALIDPGPKPVL